MSGNPTTAHGLNDQIEALKRAVHDAEMRAARAERALRDVLEMGDASEPSFRVLDELRHADLRAEPATRATGHGLWEWDAASGRVSWSRMKAMLGYAEDALTTTSEILLHVLHPDDRGRVVEAARAHVAGGTAFEVEVRLRTNEGEYRWTRTVGEVQRNVRGEPIRIVGYTADAHERKVAELAVQDSERLLRALFDGMPTAATLRDMTNWSLIDCNPAALRIVGCETREQLASYLPNSTERDLQPDGRPSIGVWREAVDETLANGACRFEVWTERADGGGFLADVRLTVLELGGRRVLLALTDDITERKRMEAALRESETRYRNLIERSRDAVFTIDRAGRIRFASPAAYDIFGFTPEEWTSDPAVNAHVMQRAGATAAAMGERVRANDLEVPAGTSEWECVHKDGHTVFTECVLSTIRDSSGAMIGTQAISRDISERRAARVMLARHAARERLLSAVARAFLSDVSDGATNATLELVGRTFDAERVCLFAVDAPRDAHRPTHAWSITGDALAGAVDDADERTFRFPIHSGRDDLGLLSLRLPEGRALGEEDAAALRAVAELVAVGRVRHAAENALARAKEDAIAASLAKSAFLANMSHELRTPLNGVIGMVDLLARTTLDQLQQRYTEVARVSASLLLSVINDILDFSKIEAGKLDLATEELRVSEIVEQVVAVVALHAQEKGILLSHITSEELASPLIGDAARLRQILVNLLSNAIKFTSRGEVQIRTAVVRGPGALARVRAEVRDTGIGIAPAMQGRLFRPFSQLDASSSRWHGGTGLGLAISRALVESMGGRIGVESKPEVGSTFWFEIDLPWAGDRGAPTSMNDPDGARGVIAGPRAVVSSSAERFPSYSTRDSRHAKPRILLVEDNAINAEVAGEILRAGGYAFDVAVDGSAAIEAVRRRSYDLVLMDCQLPELDGFQATARIRALETAGELFAGRRRLPIVALTASATTGDLERCRAAGMDEHVSKPVDFKHLLGVVAAQIARARCAEAANAGAVIADLEVAGRALGSDELLRRVAVTFTKQAGLVREAIRRAFDAGDAAALGFAAHRLRGQAGTFAAKALVDALGALEGSVRSDTWPSLEDRIRRVDMELDRLLAFLNATVLAPAPED
jgi:PAS domain S-box-containing protein